MAWVDWPSGFSQARSGEAAYAAMRHSRRRPVGSLQRQASKSPPALSAHAGSANVAKAKALASVAKQWRGMQTHEVAQQTIPYYSPCAIRRHDVSGVGAIEAAREAAHGADGTICARVCPNSLMSAD